jgi:hypothetical protein
MKPFALVCLCLFVLSFSAGCESSSQPVAEDTAAESQSVEDQLNSAGVSEEDYEKSMQESYKEQQSQE